MIEERQVRRESRGVPGRQATQAPVACEDPLAVQDGGERQAALGCQGAQGGEERQASQAIQVAPASIQLTCTTRPMLSIPILPLRATGDTPPLRDTEATTLVRHVQLKHRANHV